ncbi:MAG: branched-chain amino acid ABC transporter permease [Nitrososphaerales archaeon]
MIGESGLVSLVVYGCLLSLLFALMATGVTIIFGLMNLVNFAHGEIYMMGGYAFYYVTTLFGLNPFLAIPLAFLTGFVIGQVIERTVIRPTYTTRLSSPDEYAIVITFGISLFLQQFALNVFGFEYYRPPSFWSTIITIFDVSVSGDVIVVSIASVAILSLLFLFINHTWYGLSMKATAQNLQGAQIVGINPKRTNNFAFALGSGLAAVAGGLLASTYLVYPLMGVFPVLQAWVVVIIGGLGSLKGAVIASFILGISESVLSVVVSPSYSQVYGFVILFVVLIIRPHGLFGQKGRTY